LADLIYLGQSGSHSIQKGHAHIGEYDAAAIAVEQGHTQLSFEFTNTPAERGLCDAALGGSFGETACFRNADKVLHVTKVHAVSQRELETGTIGTVLTRRPSPEEPIRQ
jgi:hypothetical protein